MTHQEWIDSLPEDERFFRVLQGCDRCGMYLETDGQYTCQATDGETACMADYRKWLNSRMD